MCYVFPADDSTQSPVGKARGNVAGTADGVGVIRVSHLDNERVPLFQEAETCDQLAVRELLGQRSREADVNDEAGVVVLDRVVPSTVDPRPINLLAAEVFHVCAGRRSCLYHPGALQCWC